MCNPKIKVSSPDFLVSVMTKLQNTQPLIYISLNKKSWLARDVIMF